MGKKKIFKVMGLTLVLILLSAPWAAAAWSVKELETEKLAVNLAREKERGGYQIVTAAELKGWFDEKKPMLIVDTMSREDSFKKQHLPGALNLEFPIPEMKSLDEKAQEALVKLLGTDKDRTVVFYCGFTKCTRSHNAAMWAKQLGYKNVYRFPGGIKAWTEAEYPVEKEK